jgi:hypothetical protein
MDCLTEFGACSGLQASLDKSSFLAAGMSDSGCHELRSITGFSQGSFPFRFLRVPVAAARLTIAQYTPLIEKQNNKINAWTGASLSYAGRLELLNAVLLGVEGF